MSMQSALFSGVSGMSVNASAMAVIGNNIANNNTIGFKRARALFSDIMSSNIAGTAGASQVGRGVSISTVDNLFTQGTFENTARNTDLAIEGDGFFMVQDPLRSQTNYTRAGAFRFDAEGYLVNPEGYRALGYALDADGNIVSDLTDIQVDARNLSPPRATSVIGFATNLDASAAYRGPFDINSPLTTSNFTSSVTTYDSLGEEHLVTTYFSKMDPATNPLQWEWHATIQGSEVGGTGLAEIGTGILTFNTDGTLAGISPDPSVSIPGVLAWSNNAEPTQSITFEFATTQYSSPSAVISQSQDGYTTGSVAEISIDDQGNILGNFSNGKPVALFQLALAKFTNPGGLMKEGANMWTETAKSGAPVVGTAESGLGKIFTNALEQSNVDLSEEFVRMITAQRGYQASARIINSADDLLAETINLKR